MTEDDEFNQTLINKLSLSNNNTNISTSSSTSSSSITTTTTTKMSSNLPGIPPQVPLPPLPQSHYAQHLPHPQPPQSPPILSSTSSSSQIQFGSDIHARLVAFQQKRSRPLVDNNNNNNNNNNHNNHNSTSNDQSVSNNSKNNSNSNINVINQLSNNSSTNSINKICNNNNNNNHNNNNNNNNYSQVPPLSTSISMINPPVNTEFGDKPLPPIPMDINARRSFSTNDKDILQHQSHPALSSSPGLLPSNIPLATTLSKKPSLSQRRGMKLNMNDLTKNISPLASPKNNPSSFDFPQYSSTVSNNSSNNNFNSGNISSTSSSNDEDVSRKSSRRRPNFKLDLESDGSLSRGNSVNRNIDTNTPPATIYDSDTSNNPNHSATESEYDSDMEPQRPNGLFENYKKYIDIKSGRLNFSGKASLHSKGIDFSSGSSFRISLDELEYIDELGRGNYGSVSKVLHKPTGVLMAMKEVRLELDENKFTQILMELDILHKCDSPYIVDFYGAFFVEGAVYMCIEYMDGGSLDKVYGKDHGIKDETSLAYITECVIRGLKELKDKHNIIHRDVKPTNILCNTQGKIKLCDFGVSGNLVSSLAKTNIGCQSYMAPERIKTLNPNDATYSVQSDIWSLGLTILEIAEGQYPYPSETYDNIFSQLSAIVDGEPPKLNPTIFSKEAQIFVKSCLNKNPDLRPSYSALLNNNWLVKYRGVDPHLDISLSKRVEELNEEKLIKKNLINKKASATAAAIQNPSNIETVQSLLRSKVKAPALHRGGLPSNKSFLNHR